MSTAKAPIVLGIESSCDETGVGIVRGTQLLTNTVSSSMDQHVRFGGVIPEIAARAHLEAFIPTLDAALADAKLTLDEVDAIAVTSGPGLAGALMVGVAAAKALALATGKPLYGINTWSPTWVSGSSAASRCPPSSGRCWSRAGTPKSLRLPR